MFIPFFYLLRARGLKVSLTEWLTLMEALQMDLHQSSLTGFYSLCKAVLVKSESDFDIFDQVFLEYFKDVEFNDEVTKEMLEWLEHPEIEKNELAELAKMSGLSMEEIEELFRQRLEEQKEEHNGGSKWIGTNGYTAYGNSGKKLGGIRVGGTGRMRSAYRVASERKYRDWRRDNTIDSRQFQLAFRSLRQLSDHSALPKTELDVDETISQTCNNAGRLRIVKKAPRKNIVKVLMLMDSGGSMDYYRDLCSLLFQSVKKAGNFDDLKIYYFHNFISGSLYETPDLDYRKRIPTEWVINNIPENYKVIIVGDAEMAMDELCYPVWSPRKDRNRKTGLDHFLDFKSKYSHIIWIHPQRTPSQESYWTRTYFMLKQYFEMYPLTLNGLSEGMKYLLSNR